jgi:hypothetical protein
VLLIAHERRGLLSAAIEIHNTKIMVFLHGTAIMHKNAAGRTRDERVKQVIDRDRSLYDFGAYVPVDNAVEKLKAWRRQGVEIVYLSSHRDVAAVEIDQTVLRAHNFPDGPVFFRQAGEQYHNVAERVLPDILIEDDCESIGGEREMTHPHLKPDLKDRIKTIIVKEFGGIDHLPADISELTNY